MAGTLSRAEFIDCALALVGVSDELGDGWRLVGEGEGMYLVKVVTQVEQSAKGSPEPDDLDSVAEPSDPSSVSVTVAVKRTVQYQYHVLYSSSYSVPVLYVLASRHSGQQLGLEDMWALLPDSLVGGGAHWSLLTQTEHPVLGRPFYHLHPCHTPTLMARAPQASGNYLVTWLSTCAPLVGLRMPLQYLTLKHVTSSSDVTSTCDHGTSSSNHVTSTSGHVTQ